MELFYSGHYGGRYSAIQDSKVDDILANIQILNDIYTTK